MDQDTGSRMTAEVGLAAMAARVETAGARQSLVVPTDINSASTERFRCLTGTEGFYANRIVRGQPYRDPFELVKNQILPQHTSDRMQDQIVAGSR